MTVLACSWCLQGELATARSQLQAAEQRQLLERKEEAALQKELLIKVG